MEDSPTTSIVSFCALSTAKTSVRHFSDGFEFLGFIHWKRKAGTIKWYVYTFIAAP